MRLSAYGVVAIATLLLYIAASYVEIGKAFLRRDQQVVELTKMMGWNRDEAEGRRKQGRNADDVDRMTEGPVDRIRTVREDNVSPIQWGLLRACFDLLFLVPLELLVLSVIAGVFDHSSQDAFGRLFKRLGLPLLGVGALIGVGFLVFFLRLLGGLPGVAH